MPHHADVIIIGAGLAGLVAAAELAEAGKRVILLDQESERNLGGQAWWSFGGLLFVDSPEQRFMGIRDSRELCWQDWLGNAGFDREEDGWARRWAEAYVDFAAGEKRAWLHAMGMRWFKVVGWAERGGGFATGPGNSVPRFHVTWGTGTGVVEPFERRVREAASRGLIDLRFRHRVTALSLTNGAVDGASGEILEPTEAGRGEKSSRKPIGTFELGAPAVIVASGGIGGNPELVRKNWPARLGDPPRRMISGVPDHVDGLMLGIAERAGGRLVNADRMWHYVEGVHNWAPIWTDHAIRILPGPSSMWFDALGRRMPPPLFPGFDTYGSLEHIMRTGHDHSWFILNRRIIGKEFALSGSEQNPDITSKSLLQVLKRATTAVPAPVQAFLDKGRDFLVAATIPELVGKMNALTPEATLDPVSIEAEIVARDREIANPFSKDAQVTAIRGARNYRGDRLIRTAAPHRILDPEAGPLIAVKLNLLTRKSLGGLQTDLQGRVLKPDGDPLPGLHAAGEAAGFGGGGMHGHRSLEGTFLGGCIFTGRVAGRALI